MQEKNLRLEPSLWSHHPLYEAEVALFCGQLNDGCISGGRDSNVDRHFLLGVHPVNRVVLAGVVTALKRREQFDVLLMDDGTGSAAQVTKQNRTLESPTPIVYSPKVGDAIRVAGFLGWGYAVAGNSGQRVRDVRAYRVQRVTTAAVLHALWMEAVGLWASTYTRRPSALMPSLHCTAPPPSIEAEVTDEMRDVSARLAAYGVPSWVALGCGAAGVPPAAGHGAEAEAVHSALVLALLTLILPKAHPYGRRDAAEAAASAARHSRLDAPAVEVDEAGAERVPGWDREEEAGAGSASNGSVAKGSGSDDDDYGFGAYGGEEEMDVEEDIEGRSAPKARRVGDGAGQGSLLMHRGGAAASLLAVGVWGREVELGVAQALSQGRWVVSDVVQLAHVGPAEEDDVLTIPDMNGADNEGEGARAAAEEYAGAGRGAGAAASTGAGVMAAPPHAAPRVSLPVVFSASDVRAVLVVLDAPLAARLDGLPRPAGQKQPPAPDVVTSALEQLVNDGVLFAVPWNSSSEDAPWMVAMRAEMSARPPGAIVDSSQKWGLVTLADVLTFSLRKAVMKLLDDCGGEDAFVQDPEAEEVVPYPWLFRAEIVGMHAALFNELTRVPAAVLVSGLERLESQGLIARGTGLVPWRKGYTPQEGGAKDADVWYFVLPKRGK